MSAEAPALEAVFEANDRCERAAALPTPRCPKYLSLDIWRGLACVLVLVHHSTFTTVSETSEGWIGTASAWLEAVATRLWIGVPFFFVISGYCIAATVDSSRRRPNAIRTYFLRRFRRIYPPYWIVLALTIAIVVIVDCVVVPRSLSSNETFLRPWWLSGWQWFGNLTLTEIWRYHIGGDGKALYLGHAWTLCYEEQFYAVMGILLVLAPRNIFAGSVVITLATLAACLCSHCFGFRIDGFFFDGSWLMFAAGIMVYYRINYAVGRQSSFINAALLVGVLYAIASPSKLMEPEKNVEQSLLAAFVFALMISVIHRFDGRLASSRLLLPLSVCGTMCYSLYLVHLPIINFLKCIFTGCGWPVNSLNPLVTIPICGTVSVALAWVFHQTVERRFLNMRQ